MSRQSKGTKRLVEGLASNLLGRAKEVTIDYTLSPPKVTLNLRGAKVYVPGPRVQKTILRWRKSGKMWDYLRRPPVGAPTLVRILGEEP